MEYYFSLATTTLVLRPLLPEQNFGMLLWFCNHYFSLAMSRTLECYYGFATTTLVLQPLLPEQNFGMLLWFCNHYFSLATTSS